VTLCLSLVLRLNDVRAACGTRAHLKGDDFLLRWSLKGAGHVDLRLPLNFASWEVLESRGGAEAIGGRRETGRQLIKMLLNCCAKRVRSLCPRR